MGDIADWMFDEAMLQEIEGIDGPYEDDEDSFDCAEEAESFL